MRVALLSYEPRSGYEAARAVHDLKKGRGITQDFLWSYSGGKNFGDTPFSPLGEPRLASESLDSPAKKYKKAPRVFIARDIFLI